MSTLLRNHMHYFFTNRNDILKIDLEKYFQEDIELLDATTPQGQTCFAEAMGDAFGGGYLVNDIIEDSQQEGSSLKRFLGLKRSSEHISCSRYLVFNDLNNNPYIVLCDIGVKKEFQNQGFGKKMFAYRLKQIIADERFEYIFSEIDPNNFSSISLAKHFGLKKISDQKFLKRFTNL